SRICSGLAEVAKSRSCASRPRNASRTGPPTSASSNPACSKRSASERMRGESARSPRRSTAAATGCIRVEFRRSRRFTRQPAQPDAREQECAAEDEEDEGADLRESLRSRWGPPLGGAPQTHESHVLRRALPHGGRQQALHPRGDNQQYAETDEHDGEVSGHCGLITSTPRTCWGRRPPRPRRSRFPLGPARGSVQPRSDRELRSRNPPSPPSPHRTSATARRELPLVRLRVCCLEPRPGP